MPARRLVDRVEDLVIRERGRDVLAELLADPEIRQRREARRERSLAILRGEVA